MGAGRQGVDKDELQEEQRRERRKWGEQEARRLPLPSVAMWAVQGCQANSAEEDGRRSRPGCGMPLGGVKIYNKGAAAEEKKDSFKNSAEA